MPSSSVAGDMLYESLQLLHYLDSSGLLMNGVDEAGDAHSGGAWKCGCFLVGAIE